MKKHDPIAAIRSEGQKAAQLPQRLGAFDVKPLNGWMDQAETMPEATYLYHRVFVKGEVTALFAPTNAGKTIYSYQMADAVAHEGYRVLYIDCEMTLQSLRSRYFGEDAFKLLKGDNKELVIVPGASHCDLYDKMDVIPFDRIAAFYRKHLK